MIIIVLVQYKMSTRLSLESKYLGENVVSRAAGAAAVAVRRIGHRQQLQQSS